MPVSDAAPYIRDAARQGIRDTVHQIVKIWMHTFPREVFELARDGRAAQRWYRENGAGSIIRRTSIAPKMTIPKTLFWAIAVQFGNEADGAYVDWTNDPLIREIVCDEVCLIRISKNTKRILS